MVTQKLIQSLEGVVYSVTHSSLWVQTMDKLQADDLTSLLYAHVFWFLGKESPAIPEDRTDIEMAVFKDDSCLEEEFVQV